MTWKLYIGLILLLAGFRFAGRADDFDSEPAETASMMHVWRVKDGLPSDSVAAILQTRDDFLWVGTSAGLVRFDGVKFEKIRLTAAATNDAVNVTALCQDSNGYLWIGTQRNGLFELEQGALKHFTRAQGLLDDDVTSLAADQHGQVWIGGKSGLNLWTGKKFKSFTTRDGLPDESVSGVNVARSGTVWITTRVGMCRFIGGRIVPYAFQTESQGRSPEYLGAYEDQRGNLWAFGDTYLINLAEGKRFNYFRSSEPAAVRIWSLCEGRDGRLWIGTSGRGLFCFEDNRFQPVILGENRWPYDVRAICEDAQGNLWLGTSGGGLAQLRLQSVHFLRGVQGFPDGSPTALAFDAAGKIYMGMRRGGLFAGESGRFDPVGGGDGLPIQNFITSVCLAPDGTVWAGTWGDGLYGLRNGRGLHLTTADSLADDTVLALCADKKDGLWISTAAGTVHRFAENRLTRFGVAQGLPGAPVTTMIPSADGGIWLGTRNGQILREQNGKFSSVPAAEIFGRHAVLALYAGESGRLWIGSDGGGLTCLTNGVNGGAVNWSRDNELPDDDVAGVIEDGAKNLWLATGAGIYRVNHADVLKSLGHAHPPLVCQMLSEARTTPETFAVFGGPRVALSPHGELWFATSEGMLKVSTHQSQARPSTFPFYIESVAFNHQPPVSLLRGDLWSAATDRSTIQMPDDVQSLEIHFTALNFTSPEELRFRHKLEGFDSGWVDDGSARFARYGHLPYGRYRFHVAVRVANGDWREAPDTFTFTVPTPVYFQTWAICLYVIAAIALVAGIVRVISHRRLRFALARMEQQRSLERERMRIARDMHDEMGSKLTKISFLSEHAQVDARTNAPLAQKVDSIAKTSRELLKTMDEIVWVVNPRNDTLENLTAYLGHYAVEYFQNTSIECELRLPSEIPSFALSSETRHNLFLAFEEALNNVLKHSGATRVKVEMSVKEAAAALEFELKISDDGKGFEAPATAANAASRGRGGNGLRNMRQRLTAVGGACFIHSSPGAETTVTMRIGLNQKVSE